MLTELEVRDFAIIDRIRCHFAPGLNVVTGETGAGKSIIVDAVGQLLGQRADSTVVRAGCERAFVQGVFEPGEARDAVAAILEANGLEVEPELILSREIQAAGRSTARINGRAVPARVLAEIAQVLVDVHGQSESASLKREARHLDLLDRHAGLLGLREQVAQHVAELREARSELAALRSDDAEREREAELLAFQVEEIASANLSEDEEQELLAESRRLANAEQLALLANRAYAAMVDESGEGLAAIDMLDAAQASLERLAEVDPDQAALREAVLAARESLADLAAQLREYRDAMEFDPQRLEEVEERLAFISDLKRKYGPSVQAVLAYGLEAAERLSRLRGSEERIAELAAREEQLLEETGRLCGELSTARAEAAERLAGAVEAQMAELSMPDSIFEVAMTQREDEQGVPALGRHLAFDSTGVDRVAFLVSTNPGEPARPLVKVASGGETARLMLALKTVLSNADRVPTLVFDEIDSGIGGRVGAVVGQKLWGLGRTHQVLCVTHLPQVAAFGDVHLRARKEVERGRTTTRLEVIEDGERVEEIRQMLGSSGEPARETAAELLEESERWKARQLGAA